MSDRKRPEHKVLMIQTPQGVVKIDLGSPATMPEPMAKALRIFESAVDRGALDPVAETFHRLQQMAADGDALPLAAAMELMNRVMAKAEPEPESEPDRKQKSEGTLRKLDNFENLN